LVHFSFALNTPDAVKIQALCQKFNSYKDIQCNYMTQGPQNMKVRKEERKQDKMHFKDIA